MTDPFNSQPYVFPGADRPEPRRPLFGRIVGWSAFVIGLLLLLASLISFDIAGIVLGLCAAAAGGLYLFGKPSRGRIVWATPAIATLPALVAFGIMSPSPEPVQAAQSSNFAAPAIADVSTSTPVTTTPRTTTPRPSTTTPTTTVAPAPETVTVYEAAPTTTAPFVPAPEPVYVAEPEPVYVAEPEPVYVPPAPLAAVPDASSYVSYANCSAVRAAGAAPIYAGDPGYSSKLDRDGDGVGCEN